jgi:hypothetical protein
MPKPEFSQSMRPPQNYYQITLLEELFLIKRTLLKQMAQRKHASGPVLLRTWKVRP